MHLWLSVQFRALPLDLRASKCFWVMEKMMQCSYFSARCQPVASSQSTFWNLSLHQRYPLWWRVNAKKDKVILPDKVSHSINIRKQLPSIQLCAWGVYNHPLFFPTGSGFWAAAFPLQGIKRWNLSGEGVYSRQCRVRISSCYSSKHNNFMLTKTITSSTRKSPHKVKKGSLLKSPWLLWPVPQLLPVSLWNAFLFEAQVIMALSA